MKKEIQLLINRSEEEKKNISISQSSWASFCTTAVLKPFIIVTIFNILQALCGVYLVVFYAVEIISHMGNETVNEFYAAILTAGVRFVFTIVSSILLAYLGRRTIGIGSGIGTGISALGLTMLLYSNCNNNNYFAAVCLLSYVAFNTVGLFVLPGVLLGELFPAKARGLCGSLTFTISNIYIFSIAKLYPYIKHFLNVSGLFLLFGLSSLATSIFIYFTLPETKDKTLTEIEDHFIKNNSIWIKKNKQDKVICKTGHTKL